MLRYDVSWGMIVVYVNDWMIGIGQCMMGLRVVNWTKNRRVYLLQIPYAFLHPYHILPEEL